MNGLKTKIRKYYRMQMAGQMLLADLAGFGLTGAVIILLNELLHFFIFQLADIKYLVLVLLCLVLFMSSRLYPGVGINPADELRLVTQFVSTAFMLGLILYVVIEPTWKVNYWALVPAWIFSMLMVLLSRWSVRIIAARLGLWGEPVVVIGRGAQIQQLTTYFAARRRLGFVPVLGAGATGPLSLPSRLPTVELNNLRMLPADYFSKDDILTALVDFSAISSMSQPEISHALFRLFRQVIFVSDVGWLEGASLGIRDFEGLIGVEATKGPIGRHAMAIKRAIDITLALVGGLSSLPFWVIVAVLIKLESPGPIFYSQERLGQGGKKIKIYKFRSMQKDADQALAAYLARSPQARLEWDRTQKLKHDPRLTRMGSFLRKFSLDEVPQLWNVLRGEMSLVGPRPMMVGQQGLYGDTLPLYCRVRPGMSGLWQVSGRNQTSFGERAKFDHYYVHNWSIWLDLYILLRTVWVVLSRDGAY